MAPPSANPAPRRFWDRITEGSSLGQLWQQLKNDSLLSYHLYSRDLESQRRQLGPRGARRKSTIKLFFWAIVTKLSPAKRVILLAALVLIILPKINSGETTLDLSGLGVLLLLVLLLLEIADRVTLKRDLEIARDIQLWLLPKQPPLLSGAEIAFFNRPANTVSGDLYDAFWREYDGKRSLMVTVADVAGKGVPAALLMATYQAGLHAMCAGAANLAAIATGLNRQGIAQSIGGERFTTAVIAAYNAEDKTLQFVNAGHNPPILYRSQGPIERLNAGGPPLGILPEAAYESGVASLRSGDVVFIFSDGLTEATDRTGADFGEARLQAALLGSTSLSAGEILRRVLDEFDRFTAGTPRQDDVTCLVLRCL